MTERFVDLVFVYGTLLRGEVNHAALEHATFLGEAQTRPSFGMVDLGAFPAAYRVKITKTARVGAVFGQLFGVTKEQLELLDEIEGHPGHFKREEVMIKTVPKFLYMRAWIYLMTERQALSRSQEIVSGLDWRKRCVD